MTKYLSFIKRHETIAFSDYQKRMIRRIEKKGYKIANWYGARWKATKGKKTISASSLWALNNKIK